MSPIALSNRLAELLGPKGWLKEDMESCRTDWLNRRSPQVLGVARPISRAEVAAVMALAHKAGVPVTPQGGNTGLCAGSIPDSPGAIIVSLDRMKRVIAIDPIEFTATVEAGVILADLNAALMEHDLMLPMHLGAEGSAQIGGLVSTNAGGSHALRYGMMQDLVLGLEVVLPDSTVWDGARSLLKDNAGYQLRRLFCGAEGSLGIVTRAVLRLFPIPRERATALLTLPDFHCAVRLGAQLRSSLGEFVCALEFFGDNGLELALRHVHSLSFPLQTRAPAYVLVELASSFSGFELEPLLEIALGGALEEGSVLDGAIAANEAQRASFWRLREEIPEGQRLEGPQIKHDIAVPVSRLASFIDETSAVLERQLPGIRNNPFGHLGDGNIHFNLTPPEGADDFGGKAEALSRCIYERAEAAGGSFAAEHGLGRTKVAYADVLRSPAERGLMRLIKQAIDPKNLMNPGVVLRRTNNQE